MAAENSLGSGSIVAVEVPKPTEEEEHALYNLYKKMGGCTIKSLETDEPKQSRMRRFCAGLARCLRSEGYSDDDN